MLRFRRLLLCLMMLALPLQGMAAASMLYCGMGDSHHDQVAQVEESASPHHVVVAADMQREHSKLDHTPTADASEHASDSQNQLPDASHKCGVCSTCCSVLAITAFHPTVEVQSSPEADLVEPFVLIHAVPSRLPEKPPRA